MARILYIVNNPAFFVSHRLPIARAMIARGHEVCVASPTGDGVQALRDAGVRHHPFSLDRGSRSISKELGALLSLGRVFAAERPDLVHTITIKPVLYGGWWARVFSVRAEVAAVSGLGWVFLADGLMARVRKSLVQAGYRFVFAHPHARVIVQNQADRSALVNAHCLSEAQARMIAGSGVDTAQFAEQPFPEGVPLVLMASRLLVDKGVREFLEAAHRLRGQARFVLVGDVDSANPATLDRAEVDAAVAAHDIEWWGHRRDMPQVLALASIVVLPSYREGLPKVLLEAGAVGRPVVTTDVPGCRDAIVPEETGVLVSAKNSASLTEGITRLLSDSALMRRMGAAGRKHVVAHHSIEQIVAQTLAVYDELLMERHAA